MYLNHELHAYGLESMMLIPISKLVGIYDIGIAHVDSLVDIDLTEAFLTTDCKQETQFRQYLKELGLELRG